MLRNLQRNLVKSKKSLREKLIPLVSLKDITDSLPKISLYSSEIASTPEVLQMPFFAEVKHLQNATYSLPDLYTIILPNIIYCSPYNILLTQSRAVISDSISTEKNSEKFSWRVLNFSRVSKLSGYYAIFRSHKNQYYHTLIDNLPRLYLLHQSELQAIPEIKLLCPGEPTKVEKFFLDKLLPKNVSLANVSDRHLFQVENLIFPSFLSKRFAGYLPSYYLNWFIEKVAPKRPRKKVNRIFISRIATQRGQLRCILNEDELFTILQKYGFQRYVLDNLSIEEQIELFYDAEFVIGAHGAGLTNIIFSEKIKVLELFPAAFMIPHYYYLSKSLKHTYQYWCGSEKGRDRNFTVNSLEISEIIESLEQLTSTHP